MRSLPAYGLMDSGGKMAKKTVRAKAQKIDVMAVAVLLTVSLFSGVVGYLLGQASILAR